MGGSLENVLTSASAVSMVSQPGHICVVQVSILVTAFPSLVEEAGQQKVGCRF